MANGAGGKGGKPGIHWNGIPRFLCSTRIWCRPSSTTCTAQPWALVRSSAKTPPPVQAEPIQLPLPVCLAKTQYSFSTDPGLRGRPRNFDVAVRDVKVSAGAGFVVVLTGEIMTMPGLPKVPAAEVIDIDEEGRITGLS